MSGVLSVGLNFSSVLGYHMIVSLLGTFKVAEISEGKESFIHWLIRLMYGTHDDLDQSKVKNLCKVSAELIYTSVTHLMQLHWQN